MPSLPSTPLMPSFPFVPFIPFLPSVPFSPPAPSLPASPAAPRSSASATRSCQSVSSLYFHWIAVPLLRTSGSAASAFAALFHPVASTMQSVKRAPQSTKNTPVSSFFPVFIFFPPFEIGCYYGRVFHRCPRREWPAADSLMPGLPCTYPQTGRLPALRPPSGFSGNIRPRTWHSGRWPERI